eukprot:gene25573-30878_t
MSLQHFIVLHRSLASEDEAASIEEVMEKVLYFHNGSPDLLNGPTKAEDSLLTLVEALIEFSQKLSKSAVRTVVMDKALWAFLEIESNIFFAASFLLKNPLSMPVCQENCFSYLKQCYEMYYTIQGSVNADFEGPDGAGLVSFQALQALRRKIRKRHMQAYLIGQDNQISTEEVDALFASRKASSEVPEALRGCLEEHWTDIDEKIRVTTDPKIYRVGGIRKKLAAFFGWYHSLYSVVDASYLRIPKLLHPYKGEHNEKAVIVSKTLRVLDETLGSVLKGTMILQDHHLLYTSLPSQLTAPLTHLLHSFDATPYSTPSSHIHLPSLYEDFLYKTTTSTSANSAAFSYPLDLLTTHSKVFQEQLSNSLKRSYCMALGNWVSTIHMENASVCLVGDGVEDSRGTNNMYNYAAFLDSLPTVDGKDRLLFPRIHIPPTAFGETHTPNTTHQTNTPAVAGRGLFVLCGRVVVFVLLDPSALPSDERMRIQRALRTGAGGGGEGDGSASTMLSLSALEREIRSDTTNNIDGITAEKQEEGTSTSAFSAERVLSVHVSLLMLRTLRSLYAALHRPLKKHASSPLEPLLPSSSSLPSPSSASSTPPPPPHTGNTPTGASVAAGNRGVLMRYFDPLAPHAFVLHLPTHRKREVKLLFYVGNSTSNSSGSNSSSNNSSGNSSNPGAAGTSPAPPGELRVLLEPELLEIFGALHESGGSRAGAGAVAEAAERYALLLKKYLLLKNPLILFYYILAGVFGRGVVGVLNSAWSEATDMESRRGAPPLSLYQRLSTIPRGGHWLTLHRGAAEITVCMVRQCATINDVHDLVERVRGRIRSMK